MEKIRKGDFVVRNSYNKDILFNVIQIIKIKSDNNKVNKIYILKGVTRRLKADSYEEDLEKIDKRSILLKKYIKDEEENYKRINNSENTGKILHLDGDKKYSEKSMKYYKNLGLNAVVKNIAEHRQPMVVRELLEKYKPDILIITGHDGMIKKGTDYYNIYNYRTSKYFMNTVKQARLWSKDIAIFAGACQSFYEALINEGANFAASPRKNYDRFYRSINCS